IDVTRPKVTVVSVKPRVFSPDGDGRSDRVTVSYRVNEHAHALLLVNGHQRVRTFLAPLQGSLDWNGATREAKLPPGTYRLSVVGLDLAGNRSLPAAAGSARLRYLALPETLPDAAAGTAVRVPVDTDAKVVRWTVRRGSSIVGRGLGDRVVVVRAPKKPGR